MINSRLLRRRAHCKNHSQSGLQKPWFALVFLGLFFAAPSLRAQAIGGFFQAIEWSVRGSILFFPENNGNASAPMPILPSLGGGASYPLSDLLAMELSLDLYGTTYDYDVGLKRAVPANDEFRTAFVLGILVGFQPVFRFYPMGEKFTIRAYGGLSFDLRIVFPAYGLKDGSPHTNNKVGNTGLTIGEARKEITSYFWGNGRFIFPFIGGGMDFPVLDMKLGFDLRIWLPLWRIWSGENLPFIEGFRFGVGARVSF